MTNHSSSDRIAGTRDVLRDMVESESVPRSRLRRRHTAVAGLAAFVLAGALTGGAVSAVAAVVSNQTPDTLAAQESAQGFIGTHGRLIGTPFVNSGNGPMQVALGSKPEGATGLLIALDCKTGNDITATILSQGDVSDSGGCSGTSAQEISINDSSTHTLTIDPTGSKDFAVWASWVKEAALPGPSAQQKAELAKGQLTFADELAAYNRYVGCLTAAGYPMGVVPTNGPYISYAVTGAAVDSGADDRCYASEFKQVDSRWQTYANNIITTCLTRHGIAAPQNASQQDYLNALASNRLTFDGCQVGQ
jgi:hypothetical protein